MATKEKKPKDDEEKDEKDSASKGKEGEEGATVEGAEGESEGGSKKKLIIIIAAAVMVLLLAGGGAYFFLGHKKEEPQEEGGEKAKTAAEMPVYFDLPQILVNLNTGNKTVSFIKTTVTLELSGKEDTPLVEANLPRLMDSYNTFLREMKASDLYGSSGIYRLREEMLIRANKLLAPVKVKDVLFREILVQ